METFEEINAWLWSRLPDEQIDVVFASGYASAEIGPEFLGFVDVYYHLSKAIPTHFSIVDLGCSYAAQAFLFQEHKKYIGVDISDGPRFSGNNTTHFVSRIDDFISNHAPDLKRPIFAICSYVPPWHCDNRKIVRETFENVFVYYPEGGDVPWTQPPALVVGG